MSETTHTWPQILGRVTDGIDLTADEAAWAMNEIMTDSATGAQIAAFGVGVKMKGAAAAELSGLASAMLSHASLVDVPGRAVDVVGTGGDRSHTVNISTMTSVVVAAAGIPVVKHGNRAASSKSGGADVLEALGVTISLGPDAVARCVAEVGVGFCFAPVFHPAFRFTGPPRKEIGIPTVFNVLGPLTNPAAPAAGLIGCAFADLAPVLARTFAERGTSALVVRGDDGLDELTTTTTSHVWQVVGGTVTELSLDPRALDIATVELSALQGGDAQVNARIARELFDGRTGPVRDAVLLNAAGAIVAFEQTEPFTEETFAGALADARDRAAVVVDSGASRDVLDRWVALSTELGAAKN
ncbi:anthranilate phosphoribosyltransferase [Gordonia sp. (in: high G+C Gram-positive bacteria)]|uniref:anthranilate phosphoribosyltransferase n=1 Tax=Gordonia sp. (in: high G+C Gram-positive bacteria) TaxID=84139 RepID=UPI001D6E734D|nr:anthranilate phosphoribosyltransferase [Gordonia sp. (in: high G+C Gram-positive bacteria)]MCB1293931.1 anthranilate phosphoribosyltransferase [Gordonia sp. (in: high G+C Gram-positive bacteria)]HMS77540.1 anthranilate phosphoribosyltransferase [Gordonia sp. (in: high G+C Gram-positive bacteria)]